MLEYLSILLYKECHRNFDRPKCTFAIPIINCFTLFNISGFNCSETRVKSIDNSLVVRELELAITHDLQGLS